MTRKAIAVNDDNGVYDFELGARPIPYRDLTVNAARIEVVESLLGWDPWQWSIRVDGQSYFVTGNSEPRRRVEHVS